MEWVLLFLMLALLAFAVLILRKLDKVEGRLQFIINQLRNLSPTQSAIRSGFRTEGKPSVDARAVTTRRDSHDLPTTGRMSIGLHRNRRDFDGIDTDAGLPQDAGDL